METRTLSVVIKKDEDMFVAECPEVGTISQGVNVDEAIVNLKESTELYLEEFPLQNKEKPFITFFEVEIHAEAKKSIWH